MPLKSKKKSKKINKNLIGGSNITFNRTNQNKSILKKINKFFVSKFSNNSLIPAIISYYTTNNVSKSLKTKKNCGLRCNSRSLKTNNRNNNQNPNKRKSHKKLCLIECK